MHATMISRLLFALFALVSLPGAQAMASSSGWVEVQGGRLRLVTSGEADAAGRLSGVLDIQLRPGWKTYWQDPGDAGVPPQIDVSASAGVSGADFSFPAPTRHDEGYGSWAGYDRSVAFPVTFRLREPGKPGLIDASIFLGLCEKICVPVQARFRLDPAAAPDDISDAATVAAALKSLPGAEGPDFRAEAQPSPEPEQLTIKVTVPGGSQPIDLFIAGADGFQFGLPKLKRPPDGQPFFVVKVLSRPDKGGGRLPYTLVSDRGAVSGVLVLPDSSR